MLNLVPTPKKCNICNEKFSTVNIGIYTDNPQWQSYIKPFCDAFYTINNVTLSDEKGGIELYKDDSLKKASYVIKSDGAIRLYASDDEGILYALSSVMQLVRIEKGNVTVQKFEIEDYPEKEYRAFMVDMGRLWHPFDKLLKFVDICFLYKIKYLHLHFIDTGVYSLPSKAFPKLPTEGEHYTFEQIEYLNQYAKDKGIILVPEYECPGHAPQFNRAYPEIFSDTIEGAENGIYYNELGEVIKSNNIICAGSEKAWEATKILIKEICDMFPDSPYINVGADEAKISVWKDCSVCREYMKKHGLADEYELYSEYVARVTSYVLSLGKIPLVWEGFPKKGCEKIPKETIVIAWESYYHMPEDLLNAGFKIINASWQPLYIVPKVDLRWDTFDILNWDVYNWQHWWDKSDAYLNPIHIQPTDNVMGAMLCAWEQTYEQEVQFVTENLAALSEKLWTVKRVCSDDEFVKKQAPLIYLAALIIRDK